MPGQRPYDAVDRRIALLLFGAALALYGYTHDREFGGGDVAEMQMSSECLGICHPPGYALQSLVGHVFTYLPIGTIAGRVNLLSAVSAAACIALLYVVTRHLGSGRWAAVLGVAALALSDLFWRHARYAEVYAFHTVVLIAALWCAVRFIHSSRTGWWWAECVLLGAGCSARPSYLLLLPAFALLHRFERVRTPPSAAATEKSAAGVSKSPDRSRAVLPAALLSIILFAAPFALTFVYLVVRDTPATSFNYLDEYLQLARLAPVLPGSSLPDNDTLPHRSQRAVWTMSVGQFRGSLLWTGYDLVNGVRYYRQRLTTVDLGWPVFILVPLGIWYWRRRPGALLTMAALWLGDFVIYLMYATSDRITFTLPGLCALTCLMIAGMAQLISLAYEFGGVWPARAACALLSLPCAMLFAANFPLNNGADPDRMLDRVYQSTDPINVWEPITMRSEALSALLAPPAPLNARIYVRFGVGRAMQCALRMGLQRPDLDVVVADEVQLWILHSRTVNDSRPTFSVEGDRLRPWPH